jgi:hypothetical protein
VVVYEEIVNAKIAVVVDLVVAVVYAEVVVYTVLGFVAVLGFVVGNVDNFAYFLDKFPVGQFDLTCLRILYVFILFL